jgi:DNA-binding NarL/FixJ family response regulator
LVPTFPYSAKWTTRSRRFEAGDPDGGLLRPGSPHVDDRLPQLTEREILGLIAAGLSNTVIAQRLAIRPKTVRNHVTNAFAKLHVADRAQAIVRAREAELH